MRLPVSATPDAKSDLWSDRLTLLLESTGEGIYGIDLQGDCIFINRAGAAMLGWRPDELLHRNMHALVHHSRADGDHYPEAACPIFNAFRQGLPCRVDTEVFWKRDGTAFPAEYSSYPIVDAGEVRGAVVTFLDITERRRAQAALQESRDELERRVDRRTAALTDALRQLRELTAYLETVREQERTRIAREIHDELGSLLVALRLDVNWLRQRLPPQDGLERKCRAMGGLIDAAVENVGRIITDLRPSILDHQGLWAAIEWHVQEQCEAAELALDTDFRIDADTPQPDERRALAIFRSVQEMLSNVLRHAAATRVAIGIAAGRDRVAITVSDDGRGASAAAFDAPDAYGMMGMRERIGHFGGTVAVRSRPGEGTTVRLDMPLAG